MNNDAPQTPRKRLIKNGGLLLVAVVVAVTYATTISEFITLFQGWFMIFMPIGF